MSIKVNFGEDVIVIPSAAAPALERAGSSDIRLLIALCSDKSLRTLSGDDYKAIATAVGCTEAQAAASLAFWRGAGIITTDRTATPPVPQPAAPEEVPVPAPAPTAAPAPVASAETAKSDAAVPAEKLEPVRLPKPARSDQLPNYTTEQINTLLEEHPDTAAFIHECEREFGKMFNTHEVNILLGLVDYLGLDWEYILILLAYCVKSQERRGVRRSLHYVENAALNFYDEGVCTVDTLQEKIRELELLAETEGQLRTLFGMGSRALTATEKKCFSSWLYEFKYGLDIIRMAYEITVDTKGDANVKYMNSILTNWNAQNLRTPEEIKSANAAFKEKNGKAGKGRKNTAPTEQGSFDTDDFFAAALKRGMGEN